MPRCGGFASGQDSTLGAMLYNLGQTHAFLGRSSWTDPRRAVLVNVPGLTRSCDRDES